MPNPSPQDDLALFRHIPSGQLQWYPKSYLDVPEFAPDLMYVGTATNTVLNPSFEQNQNTKVEARRNLAINPDPVIDTAGWVASSISFTRSNEWSANSSGYSFKAITTGAGNGDLRVSTGSAVVFPPGISAGKTYTISAVINRPEIDDTTVNRSRRILTFISTNGSTYTEYFGPQAPNVTDVQTLTHTITVPADATGMIIGIGIASGSAGKITYVDNVLIEEATQPLPYFDGNSPAVGDYTYAWVGTQNNSASQQLVTRLPNIGGHPSAPLNTVYQSSEWRKTGTYSVKIKPWSASSEDSFASMHNGWLPDIASVRGKELTMSGTLYMPQTMSSVQARSRTIMIAVNTPGGSTNFTTVATPREPGIYTVRRTFTVPADATSWAFWRLYSGAKLGETDVYWDDIMLSPGNYTGPFSAGSQIQADVPKGLPLG